jgi:hypothetical protein
MERRDQEKRRRIGWGGASRDGGSRSHPAMENLRGHSAIRRTSERRTDDKLQRRPLCLTASRQSPRLGVAPRPRRPDDRLQPPRASPLCR